MDAGLQIKELASRLGVTEATVIKWEVRGMRPMSREVRAILNEFILKNQLIN
jgi:DNA-binding transcriptional regulator YiaG